MNKLIITELDDKILTAWLAGGRVIQLSAEEKEGASILNHIYIGKVKNIVKNIGAAFVEFEGGKIGYYSLTENRIHLFADGRNSCKNAEVSRVKVDDEIIVQVARDSVKTKAPVLSSNLNFTGRYCVLTAGRDIIGFSAKITDSGWKAAVKPEIEKMQEEEILGASERFGVIVRTNAYDAGEEALLEELAELKRQYEELLAGARYRTCYTRLDSSYPAYAAALRDSYAGEIGEIITDNRTVYETLKEYLSQNQKDDLDKLKFYEDDLLPLGKLYSLESALEKALSPRVWLKSGGYLVIEPTEALTVIDVNTGKYAGKKTPEETIFKINMEAAEEIARQTRLRNLSGIIIVDFIDMNEEKQREELMKFLRDLCRRDHVKTTVVDITPLNLVEITRKKVKRPLYEQVRKKAGEGLS
ncbi:ribonuclease E/G [Clostridium sp. AM58-1XD]|uniref:ribonuclease E/G n=1 Tax=Clostridium sp. AM58-1XD TaxID=2292307 RepID=UPI000E4BA74A|nr:ribonuclease E/G [Clostridium sp. AM58-1XD]RGY95278.1 ribonuclease E/G [Clostridium sp. AM58-1XD]